MKKLLIVIAIILTPILGVITAVAMEKQYVAPPEVEEKPYVPEKLSKYETGPPNATEVFELVNQERKKAGLKQLTLDKRIVNSAKRKANEMAKYDDTGHVNPRTGLHGYTYVYEETGSECKWAGENIRILMSSESTSQDTIDGWMKSSAHKAAILDKKYDITGIAVSSNTESGFFIVQHFCDLIN